MTPSSTTIRAGDELILHVLATRGLDGALDRFFAAPGDVQAYVLGVFIGLTVGAFEDLADRVGVTYEQVVALTPASIARAQTEDPPR